MLRRTGTIAVTLKSKEGKVCTIQRRPRPDGRVLMSKEEERVLRQKADLAPSDYFPTVEVY